MEDEIYKPAEEYREDTKDPIFDISLSDSTELWLIQLPLDHQYDFDGQKVSLELLNKGKLGTLENKSGKVYDVVNSAQEPDATVFQSSASGAKVVGKISRRISLVHYPEPDELKKKPGELKEMYMRSGSKMTSTSNTFATPTHSIKRKSTQSAAGHSASMHSGKHRSLSTHSSKDRSGLSELGSPSKSSKKHTSGRTVSTSHHTQSSGHIHSGVTVSGSSGHSHQGKTKKMKSGD